MTNGILNYQDGTHINKLILYLLIHTLSSRSANLRIFGSR